MDIANTFYVIGIICMSLITLILIALIAVAVVIKIKIDHIHKAIEQQLKPARDFVATAKDVAQKAKEKFTS
jgi:hypothetical protein